jgi:Ca2+/Na+ antiporter
MLLTIPWFLSILGGRVNIDADGNCMYARRMSVTGSPYDQTGVPNSPIVKKTALLMIGSALLYLVIQVPAWLDYSVSGAAMTGCVLCVIGFAFYLYRQYLASQEADSVVEDLVVDARVSAIKAGEVSLLGAMKELVDRRQNPKLRLIRSGTLLDSLMDDGEEQLRNEMRSTLEPFARQYESRSDSNKIGLDEFRIILHDLGMLQGLADEEVARTFNSADLDHSGHIDLDELTRLMLIVVKDFDKLVGERQGTIESDPGEEVDMPDDLEHLSPEEQQRRIKMRAAQLMLIGTLLVVIFSDPAVEVMTEIAARIDVSPFYISFILAPLASNASEVIAAYNYAKKKTRKSIQVSLTTLEGAACLNNTFCLSVFLGIVGFRHLEWTFTAEVISILFVQLTMGALVLLRQRSFTMSNAFFVLGLYPVSVMLVAGIKFLGFN